MISYLHKDVCLQNKNVAILTSMKYGEEKKRQKAFVELLQLFHESNLRGEIIT